MQEPLELSRPWRSLFPSPLALALTLFVVLTGLRAYGFLGSDLFYGLPVTIGFVLMWFVPSVFLTRYGRAQIGFNRPLSLKWIALALLLGGAAAAACYALGILIYGKGDQNWFASVAYTFQADERISQLPRHLAFVAFSVPAVIASPLGEEIFFRGVVEQANRDRMSRLAASCFAAALFALAQLLHHGIYRSWESVEIMPTSGALWFALMFATGLLLSYLRQKGESIWTAVAAHAAFNLVVNVCIFYSLLVSHPQTLLPQ